MLLLPPAKPHLCLPSHFFQLVPQLIGYGFKVTEFSPIAKPFTAVDGDDLSVYVGRKIGHQVGCKVGELLVLADAL